MHGCHFGSNSSACWYRAASKLARQLSRLACREFGGGIAASKPWHWARGGRSQSANTPCCAARPRW
eukprot:5837322-Lingulodinium_polyedra.AAC.1